MSTSETMRTSRVVVVTGAAGGIGSRIVERFLSNGDAVIATDAGQEALDTLAAQLGASGRLHPILVDICDEEACGRLADFAAAKAGKVDILVNCAGFFPITPFEQITAAEWRRVIDVNLTGPFLVTKAVLPLMTGRGWGRIITIGSCVGERVLTPGLVAYSATKGAVKMFSQGLSREVGGRGITVNNIQPGPIDTDLNPAAGDWAVPQKAVTALDRYGNVDEVVALVAFIAGPESSYITGANLTVDGGTNA